jgi:hypothetical protein
MLGVDVEDQNAAILHLKRDSFSHGPHTLFGRRCPGFPGLSSVEGTDCEMDGIRGLGNPFHVSQNNGSSFATLKQIGPAGTCCDYLLGPQLNLNGRSEQRVASVDGNRRETKAGQDSEP